VTARRSLKRSVIALASLVACGFVGYGAYAGITWYRYGRIDRPVDPHEIDPLLDRFIPVLAETPGREIVMGAVTQPWKSEVVFRALPPDEFASFDEPGYVKIVWTLRADAIGPADSMAITETRVTTTDAFAREHFRRYWAFVSPGVVLIRHMSLRLVRRDAEQRYRLADNTTVKIVPPDGGTSM
jgi:hypothetical protein